MGYSEAFLKGARSAAEFREDADLAKEGSISSAAADQLKVYSYPPATLPQSVFFTQLTWKEAQRKVLESINDLLRESEHRTSWAKFISTIPKFGSENIKFLCVENLLTLALGIILMSIPIPSDPADFFASYAIYEPHVRIAGVVMTISVILNTLLILTDLKSQVTRNVKSLGKAVEALKNCTISTDLETQIPRSSASVSLTRVVRNQKAYDCPVCLVAEGDILLIFVCEVLPCDARILNKKDIRGTTVENSDNNLPIFVKGEKLTVERLREVASCNSAYANMPQDAPCYYFRALETPVVPAINKVLTSKPHDTVLDTQLRLFRMFIFFCLLGLVSLSMATIIIFIFASHYPSVSENVYLLLVALISRGVIIIPNLQLPTTILLCISRLYGNANLLSLLDGLQNSKRAFEEDIGIDEFDAAPPPTKRLGTNWLLLFKNLFLQFSQGSPNMHITWVHDMADSLAHITLLTAVDREGIITEPLPRPKQISFFDDNQQIFSIDTPGSGDPMMLNRFELKEYSKQLNSMGLCMLMSTQCHEKSGVRMIPPHTKPDQLVTCGRVSPTHQICPCNMSRLIPQLVSFSNDFAHMKSFCIYEPSISYPQIRNGDVPTAYCSIYRSISQGSFHMFSTSSLLLCAEACDQYWRNESLLSLTPEMKSKLAEMYYNAINNNLYTIAYTYKTVDCNTMQLQFINDYRENILCGLLRHNTSLNSQKPDDPQRAYSKDKKAYKKKTTNSNKKPMSFSRRDQVNKLVHDQVFLGFQTFSQIPRPNMVDFIEDMRLAGIRFAYFSPYPLRESKTFAESLGIETDWNSCIVLSSGSEGTPGYCDPQDISAHLPRGIENVRHHINEVDDIPLLVPLFAESTSQTTREMIRIFQEHDEIVCCIGSSLNGENLETFNLADVSIAFNPFNKEVNQTEIDKKLITPFEFVSTLITMPSIITLKSNASIYAISQMIRDSRTLIINSRQGFMFHTGSAFSLTLTIYLISTIGGYRTIKLPYLCWMSYGLTPLLAFLLMFTPHSSEAMTTIPNKRSRVLYNKRRILLHFFIRFSISIVSTTGLFIFLRLKYLTPDVYHPDSTNSVVGVDRVYISEPVTSILLLFWVIQTVVNGFSFMFEYESFLPLSFLKNKIYCFFSVVLIVAHSLFVWANANELKVDSNPSIWLILSAYTIVACCLSVLAYTLSKRIMRKAYKITQKRRKLQIDTKLGMHSPR